MAIEITGKKAEVSVGEKVSLGVKFTKEWGILNSLEWNIPGKIVKNYVDGQSTAKVEEVTKADKKKLLFEFYWVDGADGRTVEAKCVFTANGKQSNKTVTAIFDVKRPKLDKFESETDVVGLTPLRAPTHLRFGVTKAGIKWKWKVDSNGAAHGKIKDIQLMLVERKETQHPSGDKRVHTLNGMRTPPGGAMLDSENPYSSIGYWGATQGGPWALSSGGNVSDTGTSDSPGMALSSSRSSVEFIDNFDYFLMYKSNTASSIWVPIGKLPWSCRGKAVKGASGWTLVSGSIGNAVNPAGADHLNFPEWKNIALNDLSWQVE